MPFQPVAFFADHYNWVKALHIIAVISWMAGMLYLPRLFVYHADADKGSELSETLKIMERKLLRVIINPAMGATWLFGIFLVLGNPAVLTQGWFHVKLTAVLLLSGVHGFLAKTRKVFLKDENKRPAKFYRILNEAPTVLMILIVIMVVVKPWQ
ncbi:MAG: protoporphyrinogen oxidase HemJ [Alphaproteobacteria bacterium]|nr:protoporphyrinogen oxidase HemJ [Alphaproteobacteria bacterium]